MEFRCLQDFSKLVSCSDIAAAYKTSRATVYLYCKKGKIKECVKTRHGYLIDPTAVAFGRNAKNKKGALMGWAPFSVKIIIPVGTLRKVYQDTQLFSSAIRNY